MTSSCDFAEDDDVDFRTGLMVLPRLVCRIGVGKSSDSSSEYVARTV